MFISALKSPRMKRLMCPGIMRNKLEKYHLMTASLDHNQLQRLLPEYATAGIDELKLNNTNFLNFDISLVIAIIPTLTFLDLSSAKMNTDQVTAILQAVRNNNNVEQLALSGIDLSGVSLQMVKESISNLKKISMHMNNLDKMSEVELIREGKIHNTRI